MIFEEDNVSCMFDASYSGSSLTRSSKSGLEGEMRIKRSSSYVYDIGDSMDNLNDVESLFGSVRMASMPDLTYLQESDFEEYKSLLHRRDLSVSPDFFRGSFHNLSDSIVDLTAFMNYSSGCTKPISEKLNDSQITPQNQSEVTSGQIHLEEDAKNPSIETHSSKEHPNQVVRESITLQEERPEVPGTFSQSSPYDIELEVLIIPMVKDFNRTELRIPATNLSNEKKKVIKRIANENDLTMLMIGKGQCKFLVLRKKVSLIRKQAEEREAYLEAERERKRKLEEIASKSEETEPPVPQTKLCSISIQTPSKINEPPKKRKGKKSSAADTTEFPKMNAAQRRKARRAAERLKAQMLEEAKLRKRDSEMQTCPDGWLICPWCTKDIPPAEQCGHVAMCRVMYRQQNLKAKEFKKKKNGKNNASTLRKQSQERQRSRSASKRKSSRSRTRSVDANLAAALKRQNLIEAQLKEIHPNDVNGMIQATQRICATPNCTHVISATTSGQCSYCKVSFCPQHKPPHTGHNCPTAPKSDKHNEIDDEYDRQAILKQRIRQRLNMMAERRRR